MQGQDAQSLSHIVASTMRTLNSPFAALPQMVMSFAASPAAGPGEEVHFAAESGAVAEWLRSSQVAVALGMLSQGAAGGAGLALGLAARDGMVASQEDAQREMKCRQALLSVQAFESQCHINVQVRWGCQDANVLSGCVTALDARW